MAMRHKVNLNFHDVTLPEDTTQPVEFAFCQNERLSMTFYLKEERQGQGWFVWVQSSADDDGLTRMHDDPFPTATEAHHAGSQLVIESVPRLVRELTKRLAMREGVYE